MAVANTKDGFVPTPIWLVDRLVDRLFSAAPSTEADHVIDPGCGNGDFIAGILRACAKNGWAVPRLTGIELDAGRADEAKRRFALSAPTVRIVQADFLQPLELDSATHIIGNPPYVSLLHISEEDRDTYRQRFAVATGRFDLYMLFFERALELLLEGGRLSFITPEKWLYVASAAKLRRVLAMQQIQSLDLVAEDAFAGRVTYPLITTLRKQTGTHHATAVRRRDGSTSLHQLSVNPANWPSFRSKVGAHQPDWPNLLSEVCERIGCGPATGLDDVFVIAEEELEDQVKPYTYRTVSGRQLTDLATTGTTDRLLLPYDKRGRLLTESELGELLPVLQAHRARLEERSCALRKPWYAYHESPALRHLLQPKLLCKDISLNPTFYFDRIGDIIPRHSVYYLVPRQGISLDRLYAVLSSESSVAWIAAHAQRAANGYIRMQSTMLKRLPIPPELVSPNLFSTAA